MTTRRQRTTTHHRRHRSYSCRFSCSPGVAIVLLLILLIGGGVFWRWTATLPPSNLLILGLDRRPEEGNIVRSDTIILTRIVPTQDCVALLSIPRDLYVDIPGHGPDRINTAHFWGEVQQPDSGPHRAMQTVAQNFGLSIQHYARVDFEGFRAVVDAVGGVDVYVEQPIVDDAYPTDDYGTIHIEIPAGLQHMDGETALRYARSRHGSSDFDRLQRQQQVLIALFERLREPEVWPRLPFLYRAVRSHIETDMTAKDLFVLAPTLYRAASNGIEHRSIDREMTTPWTTPEGGAVLLPRWEAIAPLTRSLCLPR